MQLQSLPPGNSEQASERMAARQFYSCTLSPLVAKSFAVSWSNDNRIAVVTKAGVHVLEIVPSPKQSSPILKLRRSFIQSPVAVQAELYMNDVLSQIFDWDKKNVYSFMLRDAYTPNFPKASQPQPEIVEVSWSPSGLIKPRRCLAALLTSSGTVIIAAEFDRAWYSVGPISTIWANHCEFEYRRNLEFNAGNLSRSLLEAQLDRLHATVIAWSTIYEAAGQESFAFLLTAHRNTEVALWRISQISNDVLRINLNLNIELILSKKLIDASVKISTLSWVHLDEKNVLIIVGYYSGAIGALQLQNYSTTPSLGSYSTCFENQDNIPVDSIRVLRQTDKWLEIIVVKGMHLLALVIDIHGKMISIKFVTSPGLSITGISILNSDMVLFTTQDGQLCEVKKSHDQQQLICTPIKTDIVNSQVQYLGLAASCNRVMFTLIISPSILYDHLIDREPSSIFFFSLSNSNLPSLNPLEIIFEKQQCLTNFWDCLELVKVNALKFSEQPLKMAKLSADLESLSAHELRVAYWIMIIVETVRRKNSPHEMPKLTVEIEQSRSLLFLHSACDYLELLSRCTRLSDLQKLSVFLLKTHLDVWLAGEEGETETMLTQRVRHSLKTSSALQASESEHCNFCAELVLEPWSTSCPTGHKLPRCGITRLQVTSAIFHCCPVCHEIFHPCLDDEGLLSEVICPYCNLPASLNNQCIDETLRSSKYLSVKLSLETKDSKIDKRGNDDDEKAYS